MDLNTRVVSIRQLINELKSSKFFIPEIQRGFKWDNDKVLALVDSIINGYPIGAIIVWKVPANIRREELDLLRQIMIPIDRTYNKFENMEYVVIDGLQRLCSILLIANGKLEFGDGSIRRISTICYDYEQRRLVKSTNPDRRKYIFPIHEILNSSSGEDLIRQKERLGFRYESSERNLIKEQLDKIRDKIRDYSVGIYEVSWEGSLLEIFEKMAECFTRLNTKGTRVAAPAILLALLTARVRKDKQASISFKKKCEEIMNEFNIDEFVLGRTFIAIATDTTDFRKAIRKLASFDANRIMDVLNSTKEAIEEANNLLEDINIPPDFLTSKYYWVTLAYLAYKGKVDRDKVKRWIIQSTFEERYHGRLEEQLDRDIKAINRGGCDGLLEELTYDKLSDLIFSREFFRGHIMLYYTIYCENGARDWSLRSKPKMIKNLELERLTIHHIFPRSIVGDEADHPANITLISREANSEISNKNPHEYLKKLKALDKRGCLEAHFIPMNEELWYKENYEKFLEERSKLIIEYVDKVMK